MSKIELQGIAKRLVRAALNKAVRKREMRYEDLGKVAKGVRRHFHDDITIVVIFFYPNWKVSVSGVVDSFTLADILSHKSGPSL